MKKKLYLCRHAHAGESPRGDFFRELDREGVATVEKMGRRLATGNVHADLIISSPALRALQTAQGIAAALRYDTDKIITDPAIYHQDLREILSVIRRDGGKAGHVWLFGHNPSLMELAAALTGSREHKNPPGAVAAIEFEAENWDEALASTGEILFRELP